MDSLAIGGRDGTMMTRTNRRGLRRRLPASPRGWLEQLEGRLLFSTYTVTSLGDAAGTVTPTEPGKFNATTLRAAITAANAHSGADTIKFAAAARGAIDLETALPSITGALTLTGPGAWTLTVRRKMWVEIDFSVFSVAAGTTAAFSGLRISGGTGTPEGSYDLDRRGGGIDNAGKLTLTDCVISGNTTVGQPGDYVSGSGRGAGIFSAGTLALVRSTVSGNIAHGDDAHAGGADGGGIYSRGDLTLDRCTIAGNQAIGGDDNVSHEGTGSGADAAGGGILCLGRLSLTGCAVADNVAEGGGGAYEDGDGHGGGIAAQGPTRLTDCTITGNTTDGEWSSGGGIDSRHSLNLTNSTIADNSGGFGGGVAAGGTVFVTRSVLTDNSAFDGGSAISASGLVTITESTCAGNDAPYGPSVLLSGTSNVVGVTVSDNVGGGVATYGTTTLTNMTVAGNTGEGGITTDGTTILTNVTVVGNTGGGMSINGSVTLANSIVAGNVKSPGKPLDLSGHSVSAGFYNVIGTGGSAGLKNGKNGNQVGVTLSQLHLGPLADNGGPTQTMALLPGSVAVDAGSNAKAVGSDGKPLATDQRLHTRFANGRVDVGAFEAAAVTKFYLIDTATGRRLLELKNGATIRLSALDGVKTLSIEAVTSPDVVGSVQFHLDGRSYTENLPPYGVFGTRGSAFLPGPLGLGQHDLSATPFDRIVGLGAPGTSLAARFTISA